MSPRPASIAAFLLVSFLGITLVANVQVGNATESPEYPIPPSSVPLIFPPVNHAEMKDPSGTYNFTYLGNNQYSTDLATYQRLLRDPYSGTSASSVQIIGSTVLMTTPTTSQSASLNANSVNWSGAGGGYCNFSIAGSGYYQTAQCNNPSDTLYTASAYVNELTWDAHCWNRSTSTGCETFFWAGLSPANTGGNPLIQNGICVAYNILLCGQGGNVKGKTYWDMWWEILPTYSSIQVINQYPATINGTSEQYSVTFYYSNTQPTFQWSVGNWVYSLTVSTTWNQNNYVQAEGIFEQPAFNGYYVFPMVTWDPSSVDVSAKYVGVNHYPTYVTIDSSTPSWTQAVYYQLNSKYYLEASGSLGTNYFADAWHCGPQYC